MLDGLVEALLTASNAARDPQPDDYEENGLTYCGKCRTQKSCRVTLGGEETTVYCLCECRMAEHRKKAEEEKAKERMKRIKENREASMMNPAMQRMRFNDTGDPQARKLCKAYADRFREMLKKNAGLLLMGGLGTGKSYLAACVANQLLDEGLTVIMSSMPNLVAAMSRNYGEKREEVLDSVAECSLLILDDVGIERTTETAREMAFSIVDTRYQAQRPLLVTTNLAPDQMMTQDLQMSRMYSRILEMCSVKISVIGKNLRTGISRDTGAEAMKMLEGK